MTLFALLLDVCGLSHREAADLLNVRLDTIDSWSSGRRTTPQPVIDELAALATRIDKAASESLARIEALSAEHEELEEIELGLASDDHEARSIGWPCVGAHAACLGRLAAVGLAKGYRFKIVPRGISLGSAAAVDAHMANRRG